MLEPWGERGYEFRHALLAEAVTDDLLPAERLQLHRACVEALRADPALGSSADLARHALAAGDRQVALDASVLAGDAARRMGGPAEALAHYETALALADADADPASPTTSPCARPPRPTAAGAPCAPWRSCGSRLDTDLPTDHERAELISALVLGARMTEERVDRLALTEQALGLLADDAPVGLRVGLLARRAEALMDGGASAEALAVADDAMALAVEHDLTVDRTDLASILARLSETAGDPGESIRRLEGAVAAWTSEPDLALLRAMYILASVHYRQADHPAALAAFERTAAEARRAGLEWSAYGLDARAMAVTTAYEMGDWDHALQLADHTADVAIPSWAAASIDASSGLVLAARGWRTAAELLSGTRPWWAEEGRIAVQSGVAALDVLGRDGEVDAMLDLHAELVAFLRALWGEGRVAAEVRLAALVVGHLGTALRSGAHARRTELLAHADRLQAEAAGVWGAGSPLHPPSLEGRAWAARVDAEHERARWSAGDDVPVEGLVARWDAVVDLFAEHGDPYEVARSQARLAEVLLAAGDRRADRGPRRGPRHRPAARCRAAHRGPRPARPASGAHRRRADRPRGRGARAGRRGPLERRDRPGPVHQHQDGERARLQHPRQARRGIARRGRGGGPHRGPARHEVGRRSARAGAPAAEPARRGGAARGCRGSGPRRAGSPRACAR